MIYNKFPNFIMHFLWENPLGFITGSQNISEMCCKMFDFLICSLSNWARILSELCQIFTWPESEIDWLFGHNGTDVLAGPGIDPMT